MDFSKFFDPYKYSARIKPALLLILPVVVYVVAFFEAARSWGGVLTTFLVSFGVIAFAASQMSSKGNKLQEKLYKAWGGAPTTIVLRHSDDTVERPTKKRYMQRLAEQIKDFAIITEAEEKADPKSADEMYRSATNFLREKTRDTKQYSMIFNENVDYGFARNLTACKPIGILLTLSSLVLCLIGLYLAVGLPLQQWSLPALAKHPILLAATGVDLFILLCWLFLVNHDWVRVRGFAYAKRLFASCEQVS
ncbi:hypothetical protein [Pseudomonas putida]|uniref:hypothetical protein n=1 Tax=Pseudomonas putida TaxID=303 RepID=UPI0021F83059|nr:hypothetical protein [Pseudomonas putida]